MIRAKKRPLRLIVEDGKPSAVVVPIDEYQEMFECLKDAEDVPEIARLRKEPLTFQTLDEYLEDRASGVLGPFVQRRDL